MSALFFYFGPTVLLWLAVVYKLPSLRRNWRDPGRRSYWLTLLFLALAVTLLLPGIYAGMDRLATIPNLARLLANSLILVSCWTVQNLLCHLSGAEDRSRVVVRRNGWLLIGAIGAMAALFLTATIPTEAEDFTGQFGDAPHILEYRLVYLAYFGLAQANVVRLTWLYAQVADHPSLRVGMRVVTLGGLVGLLYALHDGLYLVLRRFGLGPFLGNPLALTQTLVAVGLALVVIGSTMPSWGPRVGIPRMDQWFDEYRSLRRLYPLWLALYRATPEIALVPRRADLPTSFRCPTSASGSTGASSKFTTAAWRYARILIRA